MTKVRISRDCSEPPVEDSGPMRGQKHFWKCGECGAYTYARDGRIFHESVEEWVTLEEFRELMAREGL